MAIGDEIKSIVKKYDKNKIRIATLGSHSALNILKGAKEEGFKTLCICIEGQERIYKKYKVADDFLFVEQFSDILDDKIQEKLRKNNLVIVPHGSFNAYIDTKKMENDFIVPMIGNRSLLRWETSRKLQREWLQKAGVKVPKLYKSAEDIDSLVFVKFPGARGGKGYFIVDSEKEYYRKMKDMIKRGLINKEDVKHAYIQEYIIGVSIYPHYFYSPLEEDIELLSVDKRYESSVDGISRIPVPEQLARKLNPSFTIVGNFPMVVRESLLTEMIEIGDKIVEASKKIAPPGVIGPFCLETICTENLNIVAFEISARIVAGCNVAMGGSSPYSYILYNEPMYMGKRISRELKNAIKAKRLTDVVT